MIKPSDAGVAQSVEQLICNQQVGGSSPSTSSTEYTKPGKLNMGEFPSGQRGQTVNLLAMPSVVRIHLPPPRVLNAKAFGTFTFSRVSSDARRERQTAMP